ncbi:MAG: hypothetical protein ACYTBP_06150 [Planctomycetota bacterium]|jgi:hypothetical protein
MPNFDSSNDFEKQEQQIKTPDTEEMAIEEDMLMESILENLNSTPIGQVLKKITALPELRQKKVLDVRKRISLGQYDLNEQLDMALEKVLKDIGS